MKYVERSGRHKGGTPYDQVAGVESTELRGYAEAAKSTPGIVIIVSSDRPDGFGVEVIAVDMYTLGSFEARTKAGMRRGR